MTAPTTTAAAQACLGAVDRELADLPDEERNALLEDLGMHLAALDEEPDERSFAVRLGSPNDYAAELRSAAGLPPRSVGRIRPAGRLRRRWEQLSGSRAGREVLDFLPLLGPGWWVLRAYLLLFTLALSGGAEARSSLLLDVGLWRVGGPLLLVGAVVGSVWLGRRSIPPQSRKLLLVGEIGLVLWTLYALGGAGLGGRYVYAEAPFAADESYPLVSTAGPVTNVFPYSADGKPLSGVLLYDQDGRPLRVGAQQWWADGCQRAVLPPRAADGVPVRFSYPQQYVLDGSTPFESADLPGQTPCRTELPRPLVPLPVFPPAAVAPTVDPAVSPAPAVSPVPGAPPAPVGPSPSGSALPGPP